MAGEESKASFHDLFAQLAEPFTPQEIREREGPGGRMLSYVTARTVMNRMDKVLGPANWYDQYQVNENSVICELTVRLPNGELLKKCDAGGKAGMSEAGDDDMSGFSTAFKRAAVKYGVGRHLYRDGWVDFLDPAGPVVVGLNSRNFSNSGPTSKPKYDIFKIPPPGRAVYPWAVALEEHYKVSIVKNMTRIAQNKYGNEYWEFSKLDADQADFVCHEIIEMIKTLPEYKGEFEGVGPRKKVNTPPSKELGQAKNDLIKALKELFEQQNPGHDATNEQLKSILMAISPLAKNGQGETGHITDTVAGLEDLTWIGNLTSLAKAQMIADRENNRKEEPAF